MSILNDAVASISVTNVSVVDLHSSSELIADWANSFKVPAASERTVGAGIAGAQKHGSILANATRYGVLSGAELVWTDVLQESAAMTRTNCSVPGDAAAIASTPLSLVASTKLRSTA